MTGDGERSAHFTTDDGTEVSVSVARRELPGAGEETRIHVVEDGGVTELEEELHVVRDGSEGAPAPEERFPSAAVADLEPVHTWTDREGRALELYLDDDPGGHGSRVLLLDRSDDGPQPVTLVVRTARRIGGGGRVKIEELADGALFIELEDGRGWALAVALAGSSGALPEADEYVSPSGRVRVRVDD